MEDRSFARGALEAVLVAAGFVAFGLAWAAGEHAASGATDYPSGVPAPAIRRVILVDGYNVLHACVLQGRDRADWWKEERRAEVVALAARFEDAEAELVVVFDGADESGSGASPAGRVRQVFAPSADDWLVERVKSRARDERLVVVTGDRQVAGRARDRGAHVLPPHEFVARCPREKDGDVGSEV